MYNFTDKNLLKAKSVKDITNTTYYAIKGMNEIKIKVIL